MTTFNTGNPIGSVDPRDLYDNAENLDEAVNTRTDESWDDRFGVARKTWWGMEQDFQQFLINSGYENIGDYAAGLEITARNQIFWRDGELYRAGAVLELPYTTTGDWGDEEGMFVAVGDQALRQELASDTGTDLIGYGDGTLSLALSELFNSSLQLTPKNFGIVDGISDDQTEKVRALHDFANTSGLPVSYAGFTSISLQADAQIEIQTDVDFCGCVFSLLNGIMPSPLTHSYNRLFLVTGSPLQEGVDIDPNTLTIKSVTPRDSSGGALPDGFYNINSDRPVGNRTSDPTTDLYYQQSFMLIKGQFTYPVGNNLNNYNIDVAYRPNDRPITLSRFCVDSSTYNNQSLIRVERNGVTIDRPTVLTLGADNSGVCSEFSALLCGDYKLTGVRARAKTTTQASYTLGLNRVADVFFDDIAASGENSWGVTGTNWVTNWKILNCHLNRVDVHQGLHGISYVGGSLIWGQVQYGWGTGHIYVSGVERIGGDYIVASRYDYSGDFHGNIRVKDINYHVVENNLAADRVIGVLDFRGVYSDEINPRWANVIDVDSISIDYVGDTVGVKVIPINAGRSGSSIANVMVPNEIDIRRIRVARTPLRITNLLALSRYGNPSSGRLILRFSDISTETTQLYPFIDGFANMGGSGIQEYPTILRIENVDGLTIKTGWKNCEIILDSCNIASLMTDWGGLPANSRITTNNCRAKDTIVFDGRQIGETGRSEVTIHRGLSVSSTATLVSADALQGTLVELGVSCELPAGATFANAYSGWKRSAVFE